ncbi:DNA polymerase III subunit gamma/tau [Serpentinicella sp. ANB-PHB4]|uniref:DNA polymerase III subunit gamma/tau n=1 Tax=Serpentinicella sp. ANB-PHB4 TaxID=3074076 RepID=UPI002862900D|nr:DNA polymerase III subunit gamma/tau [Serpentinicella sp. ANB-PHB4]MDR5658890.1 DNA polymerase III subunit gamma/tau [Serpentinicella sp. ANB-PHB4]
MHKALYREWRPKVFEDVIGQNHIVTTLKNQIKSGQISHAYLFSGMRGTGKTSTAKIFARAVNCLKPNNYDPCNDCEVCKSILTESIMDVIEIDAASNNGVDNVREIRENVKYPPSKGKYKVYIIDEVHMLSTGAFNALLKTLEEPPEHVIFILATTEIHKLPATILSRCQKFDFKFVQTQDIIQRLETICKAMGVESEEDGLRVIAIHAEGGLRDALSILEQCISSTEEKIGYEEVTRILGIANQTFLINLSEKIIEGHTKEAIFDIEMLVSEGKDIHQLTKDLIQHFRYLLLANLGTNLQEMFTLSQEDIEKIQYQSKKIDSNCAVAFINHLSNIETKMKYASNPRTLLEIGVISLSKRQTEDSVEGLIERIKCLEDKLNQEHVNINNAVSHNPVNLNKQDKTNKEDLVQPKKENETKKSTEDAQNNTIVEESGSLKEIQTKVETQWNHIIDEMRKQKKASSLALLKEGKLKVLSDRELQISFEKDMELFKEKLDRDKVKKYISAVIEKYVGNKLNIKFTLEEPEQAQLTFNEDIAENKLRSIVPEGVLEVIEE